MLHIVFSVSAGGTLRLPLRQAGRGDFWLFCFANSSASSGTLRQSSNDSFHAETNLCGICRDRRARVSFAHFGGTAVSARQTEVALASETHNERRAVTGVVEGPLASTGHLSSTRHEICRAGIRYRFDVCRSWQLDESRLCPLLART